MWWRQCENDGNKLFIRSTELSQKIDWGPEKSCMNDLKRNKIR